MTHSSLTSHLRFPIPITMANLNLAPPLLCFFFFTVARSMQFDVQSGSTKCISEDVKTNAMTVGQYSVVSTGNGHPVPDSHKIVARVTSPYGNNYHYAEHVDSGKFAFTAAEGGDYMACFWVRDHNPKVTVTIDFIWGTGVAAKDWTNVAKKGQIEVMEHELRKLHDTVSSIHDEIFYLRLREEEMRELNRSTHSKMTTFSFLSIVVCLSVVALQVWHLKTFFERKKLL